MGANQGNNIRYRRSSRRTRRGVRCNSTIICSGVITVLPALAPRPSDASRGAKSRKNTCEVPFLGLAARLLFLTRFKPFAHITRMGFDFRLVWSGAGALCSWPLFADELMLVAFPNPISESAGRVCVFHIHTEHAIAHRGHLKR